HNNMVSASPRSCPLVHRLVPCSAPHHGPHPSTGPSEEIGYVVVFIGRPIVISLDSPVVAPLARRVAAERRRGARLVPTPIAARRREQGRTAEVVPVACHDGVRWERVGRRDAYCNQSRQGLRGRFFGASRWSVDGFDLDEGSDAPTVGKTVAMTPPFAI